LALLTRGADRLTPNGYGNMCHWIVIITNMHLQSNKVRLWGTLRPSGFGFGETGSVPNVFSAALTSPPG
jgi:hypothetical protein